MENSVKETASIVKDVAEAVKGVVEAVPVYQDLAQPALKEVGTALGTVGKTINMALAPLSALVWGYDKIKTYISNSLEQKLKDVPPERIISPAPEVAGPALEALRFTGHNENLRELYSNLLARSMDSLTAEKAHPAFVEILKQLTTDEAKILNSIKIRESYPIISVRGYKGDNVAFNIYLRDFSLLGYESNCIYPELIGTYLENFQRLGLLEISYTTYIYTGQPYEPIINHHITQDILNQIGHINKRPQIDKGSISFTELGKQFYAACIE